MALSTKTLDALNDSRKTEPHKYIWGQFTPDKDGVGYSDLPEQTIVPDDAKLVLDVNGPSLVKASVKDLKNGISESIATTEKAGIVKVGNNLTITEDGTLNADTDTLATKTDLAVALNERADKQLSNTNLITNCILSAPNGVMTIATPISEQLELSNDAVITDSQLTTGNAYFNTNLTKNGFDKDSSWTIKTTFKITKNETNRNIVMFQNFAGWKVDGINSYDYLEIFGVVYSSNILTFEFLGGYNDAVSFIGSSKVTAEISLNTEYTATYSSNGHYSLYQGDTKIKDFLSESYAFSTLFSVAQNSTLGTLRWGSKSGDTPINFKNTNLTYNNGVKTVPVVGDPYTLTVNKGLKVALANGYNADGTPKSEIVTLENDVTLTLTHGDATFLTRPILVRGDAGGFLVILPAQTDFQVVSSLPSSVPTRYTVFFNITENKLYEYYNGSGGLNVYNKFVMLGSAQLTHGQITQVFPYKPIQLSLEGLGDYVVEFQVNSDGSWYRKYKSGWLEQGARYETSINIENITFLKPFASIPLVLTSVQSTSRTSYNDFGIDVYNLTTTGFTKQDLRTVGMGWGWEAKGMGAS